MNGLRLGFALVLALGDTKTNTEPPSARGRSVVHLEHQERGFLGSR
jgi:hypothetical protein